MEGLRPVVNDEQLALLRILVDRRRSLGEHHTRMISQLHQLLLELIPGRAKKSLSAAQAKALLATVKPRDTVGKARRRVAAELIRNLQTHRRLLDTETRMTAILDELRLTELATSITGLSAIGAAAILAETGDPSRFATGRALVKHAGLAPREKLSGNFIGRTKLTGQGRPGLRLAAWRAVWGAQRANPVYAARFTHLTNRQDNKLTVTQAQAVIAAAILRQLHAVITTGQRWDPVIATHGAKHPAVMPIAA